MKVDYIKSLSYEIGVLMAVSKCNQHMEIDDCVGMMLFAVGNENLDKDSLYSGIKNEIKNQFSKNNDLDDNYLDECFNDVIEFFKNDLE